MKKILLIPLFFLCLALVIKFVPLSLEPAASITVTGEARQDIQTQIARFTAAVSVSNRDKQAALDQVNQTMAAIIPQVKDFGIEDKDIQTQTVSVNKNEEKTDEWQASNSITITLRAVDQASALADLLQSSGATNVYGPSFSIDETTDAQIDLLQLAIDNAREKAEEIAQASSRKLGKVLTVSEGYTSVPGPLYRSAMSEAVPTPVEPGSETVYKTVTVTFQLK